MKNHFAYIHGYLLLSTLILFITCTHMAFTASIGLAEEAALLPEGESSESDTDAEIAAPEAELEAEDKQKADDAEIASLEPEPDDSDWEIIEPGEPDDSDRGNIEKTKIEAKQIFDAIEKKDQETALRLIEAVHKQDNKTQVLDETNAIGNTLLYAAVDKGFTDIIPLLIVPKHLSKYSTNTGLTPLQRAIQKGNKIAVAQLVTGEQLSGDNGQDAVKLAQEAGHKEIVELLRRYGVRPESTKNGAPKPTKNGTPEPTKKAPKSRAFRRIKKWWRGY